MEVRPLVDEVNQLLDAQEESLSRARDRAADLAHGLKTPLTALTNDVYRLRAAGQAAIADDIEDTALRMKQIVERELARSRIRNSRSHRAGFHRHLRRMESSAHWLARRKGGDSVSEQRCCRCLGGS